MAHTIWLLLTGQHGCILRARGVNGASGIARPGLLYREHVPQCHKPSRLQEGSKAQQAKREGEEGALL
eukprot:240133-Pelagomonas_calceolata.AAC.4